MRRIGPALAALALASCAATRAFDPPPAEALAQIRVSLARAADSSSVTLRNDSRWGAQYLFPLFACSRAGDFHEDADPRAAARFASANPERGIWERALAAGSSETSELSRSPCAEPHERVGVYFKLARDGIVTYRVVWSDPIGPARTGL